MRSTNSNRPGFALAVALFAMVVIGALVAGAFFSSTQEFRIGRNTLTAAQAMAVAEGAQNGVLANWTTDFNTSLKNGDVWKKDTAGTGWRAGVSLTRLNLTTFWLVSEGVVAEGSPLESRRRTGMILRLATPQMNFRGGLTTRGAVDVTGSSLVDGRDTNPTGWDCPPTNGSTDMPGVAIPNPADVNDGQGCTKNCIGNPPVAADPAAADTNTYFEYGDSDWDQLVKGARVLQKTQYTQVKPLVVGGKCDKTNDNNWGDPNRAATPGACESYFPTMYAPGDLGINGDMGQGMLLVNGDLTVQGNFEFMGPVIVRGAAYIRGTGGQNAKFTGGIMAANVYLEPTDDQQVTGNATVTYSRCALLTVLANTTYAVPARVRGWADMF